MNLNKKIGYLLDSGLTPNFISSINESTIDTLYNRLVETKKKETKEAITKKIIPPGEEITADLTDIQKSGLAIDGSTNITYKDGKIVATKGGATTEGEIKEKFESKAQQGLFWAKCNKCKTDDCKWCKMAKEFSKSTSKKQYEKMPEKKHPEKTVKYKKKNTNEEFTFKDYFNKVASAHANNAMGKLTKEEIIKKQIDKIVETNLEPTMKKRELLRLIESQSKNKRNINEDFYFDGEMKEMMEFDMPTRWDEDEPFSEPAKPSEKSPKGKFKMNGPAIIPIRIDPDRKREREIDPDEWQPDEEEPENPEEGEETKIQGRKNMKFMSEIRNNFNRTMNRLNETHYKPIKYKKY